MGTRGPEAGLCRGFCKQKCAASGEVEVMTFGGGIAHAKRGGYAGTVLPLSCLLLRK